MAKLEITNKRKRISYINISYNSLAPWDAYKSDYVFSMDDIYSGGYCSNFRVETLPHQGQLFKGLHDGQSYYIKLNVGDFISFDNIVEETMLRFKAEGFEDNQFTGNYNTFFQLRCIDTNELVTVNISTTDTQQAPIEIPLPGGSYEIPIVDYNCVTRGDSPTNFDNYWYMHINYRLSDITGVARGRFIDVSDNTIQDADFLYIIEDSGSSIGDPGMYPYPDCYKPDFVKTYRHTLDNGNTFGGDINIRFYVP